MIIDKILVIQVSIASHSLKTIQHLHTGKFHLPFFSLRLPLEDQLEMGRAAVVRAKGQGLIDGLHVQRVVEREVDVGVGRQGRLGNAHPEQRHLLLAGEDVVVQRRVHLLQNQLLQVLKRRLSAHLHRVRRAKAFQLVLLLLQNVDPHEQHVGAAFLACVFQLRQLYAI